MASTNKKAPTSNAITTSAQLNTNSISTSFSRIDVPNVTTDEQIVDDVDITKDRINMHFFDENIPNEVVSELNECKNILPRKLTNADVRNLGTKYGIDNVDVDFAELDDDTDEYEEMSIEIDGMEAIINIDMCGDFVRAINSNTQALRDKWKVKKEQLESRYTENDAPNIDKYNEEYTKAYQEIIGEELDFLLGPYQEGSTEKRDYEQSVMKLFVKNLEFVKETLIGKSDDTKSDYKKIKKNFNIVVTKSSPISVMTGFDITTQKPEYAKIYTKIEIELQYKKKKSGKPKTFKTVKIDLLK